VIGLLAVGVNQKVLWYVGGTGMVGMEKMTVLQYQ
jgi:hypothetical protein